MTIILFLTILWFLVSNFAAGCIAADLGPVGSGFLLLHIIICSGVVCLDAAFIRQKGWEQSKVARGFLYSSFLSFIFYGIGGDLPGWVHALIREYGLAKYSLMQSLLLSPWILWFFLLYVLRSKEKKSNRLY